MKPDRQRSAPSSPATGIGNLAPAARRSRGGLQRATIVVLALLLAAIAFDRLFPLPLPARTAQDGAIVLARDGTPLRAFADGAGIWRYPVTLDQVSPLYLQTLLNYEDRWFWWHPGINPPALLRAFGQMLLHRHVVSGGSTLTMQVARIIDPHPRSLTGKLWQLARAMQLEAHLSKREILTLYLNHAPYGGAIEGVQAASYAYLGKPASQLSHAEAALLTVLPQSPSRWRPDRDAAAARIARDKVLQRMRELQVWSEAEVADAQLEAVATRRLTPPLQAALLAERLHQAAPGQPSIRTTIDSEMQGAMEARVAAYLAHLPDRTSAALLIVANDTLDTLAYVGSGGFDDEARLGQVDMVRAWRSPGSTLKPFLYGLALDDGLIDSESLLLDAPQSFGDYRPGNFSASFSGPVGAAEALRLSLNVPAVDLLDRIGPGRFVARLGHAGLTLKLPPGAEPNLSIILGGGAVRLEDLVGAFVALNRDGHAAPPRLRPEEALSERYLLSPGAAWIVRAMLEANPRPGYAPGTFALSAQPRVAWKTGTSYGFRDAWAIGTTRRYTVGVWIGRPDGTPLPGQYGAVTALPLLFQAIDSLPRSASGLLPELPPPSVSTAEVCWPLGLAFDPLAPELCQRKFSAWVLNGVIPPTLPEREARVWSSGRISYRADAQSGLRLSGSCHHAQEKTIEIARWPALAYPWLTPTQRQQAELPALAADCATDALQSAANLRIEGVAPNATIARAPGSAAPATLNLRAIGADSRVLWLINGRLEGETSGSRIFEHAFAAPGPQTITAMTTTGAWAQLEIEVLR